MKKTKSQREKEPGSELLVLPDGRVMVHNLTPCLAAVLTVLDPADRVMKARASVRPGKNLRS